MALARIWFLTGGTALQFDATIRESATFRLNVTKNPVETGVTIADHAFMEPISLEIEACVSDFMLHPVGDADVDDFASPTSRAAKALQVLQDWQTTAEPATIQTGLRSFQNMVMETFNYSQDAANAGWLNFTATLTEVITVSTRTVVYPPRAEGKAHRQASKKVDSGQKQAELPPSAEDTRSKMLKQISGDGPLASAAKSLGISDWLNFMNSN